MKRVGKKLTALLCAIACVSSLTACGKGENSQIYIMSDVQEGDHPTAIACDEFAKDVYKQTDGRIDIRVYHGDTLGAEADQLKQVTVGGIDFARVSGPLSKYEEKMGAFQSLYLYNSEDDMWKILNGSVGDSLLNNEEFAKNNITGLCWFSGGSRNFYNDKKEITSPKDLSDLKIRVNTDSMIQLVQNNGGKALNIAYNDIYHAIKGGTIDGAENNWPSYITTGHYKVAKYITVDSHTMIPEMIVASTSALEGMSAQDQEIVKKCAKEASKKQIQAFKEYDKKAIEKAKKSGCVVTELTPEQSQEFKEQGTKINEEVNGNFADTIKEITGK